jgi:hypothetical protein
MAEKMWDAPKGNQLTDQEKSFLKLIMRSPDDGDGWRNVSAPVWRWAESFPRRELVELSPNPDGSGRLRLSERGQTVKDYL